MADDAVVQMVAETAVPVADNSDYITMVQPKAQLTEVKKEIMGEIAKTKELLAELKPTE